MQRILTAAEAGISPERQKQMMEKWAADAAELERHMIRKRGVTRSGRKRLLLAQQGRCALCQEDVPHGKRFCYDKPTQTIVCQGCMLLLTSVRTSETKGITVELLKEFMANNQHTADTQPTINNPIQENQNG